MSYVKQILFPGEHILYDGHVHPRVLLPGLVWLGLAAWIVQLCEHTGSDHSWLLRVTYSMAQSLPWSAGIYRELAQWQAAAPDISVEGKILALGVALYGFSRFMQAMIILQSTELVVTERRIIAKYGIMAVYTVEMERNRVLKVRIEKLPEALA